MQVIVGQKFGKLTVRMRFPPNRKVAVNMQHKVRVECSCGSPAFTVPLYYLTRKNDPRTDCGCGRKTIKTTHNQEYRIWLLMHERCENPKHRSYRDYGKRGISVCEAWQRSRVDGLGFANFLQFVGARPSPGHSIDRIDNDLGYQPFKSDGVTRQVRWATAEQQRANQRPRKVA